MNLGKIKFVLALFCIETIFLVLFANFTVYNEEADASNPKNSVNVIRGGSNPNNNAISHYGPLYQDVHVMIFIGFGFLMTFLKKYGYSALSYNFLIASVAIQWSILCNGVFHHGFSAIPIDITTLINGDFAAGAVLITFGAVLGVTNPLQLLTVCLVEVFLYTLNEYIGAELFKAIDVGGSMYIHTFGAYFGIALSRVLRQQQYISEANEGSDKISDLFSMIGTVFLWIFWPSFNGALAVGDDQHRAVINTVLSLTASCIVSFAISAFVHGEKKFNMVHIQNATLAGGVAVGAVADLMIRPFGAILIGSLSGTVSVLGYTYLMPLLQRKIGLHDTCGVHNLHGMPGVISGLAGALMAAIASERDYGIGLYTQYPARAPLDNSTQLVMLRRSLIEIQPGYNRTAGEQAIYQLAALGVTLTIAIVGGAITGLLLKSSIFGRVPNENLFDDSLYWEVPGDDEKAYKGRNSIANPTFGMGIRKGET